MVILCTTKCAVITGHLLKSVSIIYIEFLKQTFRYKISLKNVLFVCGSRSLKKKRFHRVSKELLILVRFFDPIPGFMLLRFCRIDFTGRRFV